ncbi:MAG: AmmeMemoRadiSam system protein B [Gammaproteobacteria bacterium]|nr:AmmeMemoRadiSam system protein B [Gammaproteobacteria bacterium]MDH5652150.1 AmmeMemoRadiSam system protein B [Gammaproteobacteria bacterium]
MSEHIRHAAVAGMFYPDQELELRQMVQGYLNQATPLDGPAPKAIIAPHAGYIYSGPVAASAYINLLKVAKQIQRVVLLGPAHRVPVRGIAASSAGNFATPLGLVPIDMEAVRMICEMPGVRIDDEAHMLEHSLEVHLPFLQVVLDKFTLVPLLVGRASAVDVDLVLSRLWNGPETLLVISSDLSHYHDYKTARELDKATSEAIEKLDYEHINYENACGRDPVNGLLHFAKRFGLHAKTIDLRNSGDTAGPHDKVVGYGAYLFH